MLISEISGPIHFIGIGGSGMAGLAEIAAQIGLSVQGSDISSSAVLDKLITLGVRVTIGHNVHSVENASVVVFTSAVASNNVELVEAAKRGIPRLHRSDFLKILMAGHRTITIAGTHGKSTTSAMVTHMLDDLGCKPWAATGGEMIRYQSPVKVGDSDLFVAEADESDGTFIKYTPYIGVITNVEADHMDYFKTEHGLIAAFKTYLDRIDKEGTAIIGWDHKISREIGQAYQKNKLTYGFVLGCDVRAREYTCKDGLTHFTAIVERDHVKCALPTMGQHNVQNALCALAVARSLELDVRDAASSLSNFCGVKRRMARIYNSDTVIIFDDYAHNPGKIAAGVKTLRQTWPERKLHVVYQPHRFSRLETMYNDMLEALDGADFVYVLPVYSAGETTELDFSPARIARDLRLRMELEAIPCVTVNEAVHVIEERLVQPAIVLTVGAGDVWQVAEKLKDALA